MNDTWLTIKEASERLHAAVPTVRVWCQRGLFPHAVREETARGPVWRIPQRDVDSFERPPMGYPRGRPRREATI